MKLFNIIIDEGMVREFSGKDLINIIRQKIE